MSSLISFPWHEHLNICKLLRKMPRNLQHATTMRPFSWRLWARLISVGLRLLLKKNVFKINKLTRDSCFDNGLDQDPLAEHDRLIVASATGGKVWLTVKDWGSFEHVLYQQGVVHVAFDDLCTSFLNYLESILYYIHSSKHTQEYTQRFCFCWLHLEFTLVLGLGIVCTSFADGVFHHSTWVQLTVQHWRMLFLRGCCACSKLFYPWTDPSQNMRNVLSHRMKILYLAS